MRIFVTGVSGFIGSAVAQELLSAGHSVVGLARSDAAAKVAADLGVTVHRGDLEDPSSVIRGAADADGVIHLGFNHDFTKFKDNCESDRRLIEALGAELGTRPLIVTSVLAILPRDGVATEEMRPVAGTPIPRVASEEAAASLVKRNKNVSVIRLPPSVHGKGDHAFVPTLMQFARDTGVSAYVDDGANTWPAVHRVDAAKLYRLAFERAQAGACYHAVAEEGISLRAIAEAIGRKLDLPVASKSHFGWFTHFATMSVKASSAKTRAALGWTPSEPGLIADIAANYSDNRGH